MIGGGFCGNAQQEDTRMFRELYTSALTEGKSYDWLNYLSNQIGGRLSGSVQAEQAVTYTKKEMEALGLDRVWLQPVMVPKWVRGTPEFAYIESEPGVTNNVPVCALGGSIATPAGGLKASVIEVKGVEDLPKLGRGQSKVKSSFIIVRWTRP